MKFGGSVAIVAYRSVVAGIASNSLDIQARWFAEADPLEVRRLIQEEQLCTYTNSDGDTVCWVLAEVFAIEPFSPSASGDEVAGFITNIEELTELLD